MSAARVPELGELVTLRQWPDRRIPCQVVAYRGEDLGGRPMLVAEEVDGGARRWFSAGQTVEYGRRTLEPSRSGR